MVILMKKKEMMKEQKKIKAARNQKYFDFSDSSYVKRVFLLILGVIAFFALAYVFINVANGNWNLFSRENEKEVNYDPQLVMCGTMFNRTDSEYVVLAYHFTSEDEAFYQVLTSTYSKELPLYYLDLESGFNKACVGESNNLVNDPEKIKISSPTLIHIKNGKIVKSYITEDTIKAYFK